MSTTTKRHLRWLRRKPMPKGPDEWAIDDRFTDSKRRMLARIVSSDSERLTIKRWPIHGGRRVQGVLTWRFWNSPSNGWRRA